MCFKVTISSSRQVFITGLAPNGPARGTGIIRRGDQLISVDDVNVNGWDVNDIVRLIVGEVGSAVKVRICVCCHERELIKGEGER